jgi:hypothetical protein
MAIIYSYPVSTPKVQDLLLGTSIFDENDPSSERTNPTVSFTVQSLVNLIGPIIGSQNLQQVTGAGNTTTNSIIISSNLSVNGSYTDSFDSTGSNGEVLTSQGTGTQTKWLASTGGVTSVGLSMPAAFTVGNSPITLAGTIGVTGAGDATQYINGAGNLVLLSTLPQGAVTSLTTTGTGAATLVNTVLNIPTPVIPFRSLTTTGTSGASSLTSGVLNVPNYSDTQENTTWYVRDSANTDKTVNNLKYLKFITATGVLGTALTGDGTTSSPFLMTLTSPDEDTGITSVVVNTGADKTEPLAKDITGRVLTLTSNVFGGGNKVGYVPASSDGTQFLKGDGTWGSIPSGLNYEGVWDARNIAEGGVSDGGDPNLTATGLQGDGILYICTIAGSAEPNGSGVAPSAWSVGDWCVYSGVAGSGAWTRVPATNAGVTTFSSNFTSTGASDLQYISGNTFSGKTGAVDLSRVNLNATGTASATTFLRGDNAWSTTIQSIAGNEPINIDITNPYSATSPRIELNYEDIILNDNVVTVAYANADIDLIEDDDLFLAADVSTTNKKVKKYLFSQLSTYVRANSITGVDGRYGLIGGGTSGQINIDVNYSTDDNVILKSYNGTNVVTVNAPAAATATQIVVVSSAAIRPGMVAIIGGVNKTVGAVPTSTTISFGGVQIGTAVSTNDTIDFISVLSTSKLMFNTGSGADAFVSNNALSTIDLNLFKTDNLPGSLVFTPAVLNPPTIGIKGQVPAPPTTTASNPTGYFLRSNATWGHAISSLLTSDGLKGGPISQSGTVSVEYSGQDFDNNALSNIVTSPVSFIGTGLKVATDDFILFSDTNNFIDATSNATGAASGDQVNLTLSAAQDPPIEVGMFIYNTANLSTYYGVVTAVNPNNEEVTCDLVNSIGGGVGIRFKNNTQVKKALVSQLPFVPSATSFISTVTADNGLKIGGTSSNPIVEASYSKAEFEVNTGGVTTQKTFTLTIALTGIDGATVKNIAGQTIGVVDSVSGFTVTCVANLAFAVVDGEILTFSTKPKNLITAATTHALGILDADELLVLNAISGLVERKPVGDLPASSSANYYVTAASYSTGTLTLTRNGGLGDLTATGFLQIGTTASTALAGDTTTITSGQASAITANTAKVGITTGQANAIVLNTAKVTDTGIPAILSNGTVPSLNSGITDIEVRTLIGAGTVTSVGVTSGGSGVGGLKTVSGSAITGAGTIGVKYVANDNIIMDAESVTTSGGFVSSDEFIMSVVGTPNEVRRDTLGQLKTWINSGQSGGTVTSVTGKTATAAGNGGGITVATTTSNPVVGVYYGAPPTSPNTGIFNVISAALSSAQAIVADDDEILIQDPQSHVTRRTVSLLPFTNNTGTVTPSSTDTFTNKSGSNSQWTNDENYTTNTGTTTADNTQTFTNKSGSNSQWTNDEGYTTNTGTVTPSSTDTFTNKSGSNSQWTNDEGYTTNVGTIQGVTGGVALEGAGTSGVVTLNVRYAGTSSVIFSATNAKGTDIDSNDVILYTDVDGATVNYGSVSDLPFENGTVTSITLAAGSGTGSAINTSGTFTFTGGTNVTTSVSGTTVTINSTDQYVGTVTSSTATSSRIAKFSSGTNVTDSLLLEVATGVNLTGTFTASADVIAYSDERLKSNIKTLDGSKVYEMRGVSFDKDGKKGSGVIAQEMQKVAPELVNEDSEYLGVAYGNISGYLIEAIKELKQEIEELKNKQCNCKCK